MAARRVRTIAVACAGLAAALGACGPAPVKSRLDPARVDWRIAREGPATIEIFNEYGQWALSCASGGDLVLTGPISTVGAGYVRLRMGEVILGMKRHRTDAPEAYAVAPLTPELIAGLTNPGLPPSVVFDGLLVRLRAPAPEVKQAFADACREGLAASVTSARSSTPSQG